jgi:hypothetical protein
MTTTTLPLVGGPGVYDIPADVYHADPVPGGSLSSTGTRKLLRPSCPAKFRHWLDEGQDPKKEFDLGHAAHREVLGVGARVVLVERPRWDTNEVKAEVAEIRSRGDVPLKRAEYDQVKAMAKTLREHPIAGPLFEPGRGVAEQTLVWQCQRTGVWCRAMLDWLIVAEGRRTLIVDYKSCVSAAPDDLPRVIHQRGYHVQDAHYRDGVEAVDLAPDGAAFVFVYQEKTPPYVVTVTQLPAMDQTIGADLCHQARDLYRQCMESGRWPGYSDDIEIISLPPYVQRQYMEDHQ